MSLKKALEEGIVLVKFTKKNGEIREMLCTLQEDYLPEVSGNSSGYEGITTVYDLEKQGWRAFRDNSVIDYSKVGSEKE